MLQPSDSDFIDRLTAQSALAEVPSHDMTLDLSVNGEALGETLDRHPNLPGVVLRDGESVLGVISRGQYLRLIGRQFGREVFHPRPLKLLWEALGAADEPLVLAESTPIQNAVAQALDRPRSLIYEPVIVDGRDPIGAPRPRLVDFPDLLRADSRISALRNQQMQQILSTVQEGFLLVDADHRIASEYSASIETILGRRDLAGRSLPAALGEIVGARREGLARDYLETLFNPNVIERLITKINPLTRVERTQADGSVQHLAFRFLRGLDDAGVIRRVLVRIEDVTREVALAAEVAAQEQRAEERVGLVFDIVAADGDALSRFLRELDAGLTEAAELWSSEDRRPFARRLAIWFRRLHRLKGEAGLLGLRTFEERIHRAEDTLQRLRDAGVAPIDALPELREGLRDLERLRDQTRAVIDQFRRLGGVEDVQSKVPASTPRRAPSTPMPAASLFDQLEALVRELAERLGKPARFVARCREDEVPEAYRDLARDALIQFARNSMVHGLESSATRRERGKPELGTLQFALRRHPERLQVELIFQDDGGGLDLDAIRRRAIERGLSLDGPDAVIDAIFTGGLSTADGTTRDAGRGVGLDVVRDRVRAVGGTILPHSKPGVFCAFQILLPQPEVVP